MKRNHNLLSRLGRNAKALLLRLRHASKTNDLNAFLYWLLRMSGEGAWVFFWVMVPVSICIAPFHKNGLPFAFAFACLAMLLRTINVDFGKCNR